MKLLLDRRVLAILFVIALILAAGYFRPARSQAICILIGKAPL